MGKLSFYEKGQAFGEQLPSTGQRQREALCYLVFTPLTIPTGKIKNLEPRGPGWNDQPRATEQEVEELGLYLVPETPGFHLLPPAPTRTSPALSPPPGGPPLAFGDIQDTPTHSCMEVFPGPQEWRTTAGSADDQERSVFVGCFLFPDKEGGPELQCVVPRTL